MENGSSAPGVSLIPDGTGLITATHLGILAVLAVLAVLAILYGARLKRGRHAAKKELEVYNRDVERRSDAAGPPPAASPAQEGAAQTAASSSGSVVPAPLASPPALAGSDAPPAPAAAEPPGSEQTGADGPVTQLKGLGPKLAAKLHEQGITTVGQIAALDDDDARALDSRLGPFAGRMARDRWVEQARFLAAGDRKGFEAVFGRL